MHHAVAAGDVDTVLSRGQEAARQAAQAGSHRQALAHYEQVVPHLALLSIAVCATAWRDRIVPWGDDALLEAKVREVGHHLVLVGPYSRFEWHHPGPALFYVLAVPYRIFGSQSFALNVAALLIATGSVVLIAWLVWRRVGAGAVWWTMALIGIYLWALGPDVLRTPWNPWITILPLLAVVMLVWSVLGGSTSAYPRRPCSGPSSCRATSGSRGRWA